MNTPGHLLMHMLGKCQRSATGTVRIRLSRLTQRNAANDGLTYGSNDRAVQEFSMRLNACVVAKGGHFNYSQ